MLSSGVQRGQPDGVMTQWLKVLVFLAPLVLGAQQYRAFWADAYHAGYKGCATWK